MRVLILGGAGYIGGVTARLFEEAGHDVTVFDNLSTGHRHNLAKARLIEGDIQDRETVQQMLTDDRYDAILCFAAKIQVEESMREPYAYLSNNTFGVLNVVDAATQAGISNFIFSSTAAVYGEPSEVPVTEEAAKQPINPYGLSKYLVEQILAGYQITGGLNWVAFRYFNAAGAYQGIGPDYPVVTHLISRAILALQGEQKLSVFGSDYDTPDGTAIRDYVHVVDIARAHVIAAEQMHQGKLLQTAINLGSQKGYSVMEVIKTLESVADQPVPQALAPRRAGDPARLIAGNAKAQELLGWQPEFDLKKIVTDALEWYQHK